MSDQGPLRVVIVGGGVAAAELALALPDLAPGLVDLTIVSPGEDLVMRPFHPGEAFSVHARSHYPMSVLAERSGARHVQAAAKGVDAATGVVQLDDGQSIGYDVVALMIGARSISPYKQAVTFRGDRVAIAYSGLLSDIEQGYAKSLGFVVPPGMSWPLPLYELALLTAREARSMGVEPDLTLITPELHPLAVFGPAGSAAVADLLHHAGISFVPDMVVEESEPGVFTTPGGRPLETQRIVTIPVLEGIALPGVPADPHGFIPIDEYCRVKGMENAFAAGDGTSTPVKQGGIACQQADVVAEQIAKLAGAPVEAHPVQPVLRGRLMTGSAVRYISDHDPTGGEAEQPMLFAAHKKVDGRYLSPWIAEMDGTPVDAGAEPSAEGEVVDIEVTVTPDGA